MNADRLRMLNAKMSTNRFWSNPSLTGIDEARFIAVLLMSPEFADILAMVREFGYEAVTAVMQELIETEELYGMARQSCERIMRNIRSGLDEAANKSTA